ncbi:MAG: hypothetical protein H0W62_02150 [Chitinophagales bacterium]|nr:hypothetical protein [Chitinophagales bacterium]
MKNILRNIFLPVLIILPFLGRAQGIVMKNLLSQDHKGTISKTVNFNGKPLYFEWKFDSTTYNGLRVHYHLMLADNNGMKNAVILPVMIRDLIRSTYFEIYFNNGKETKTFTSIFNKDDRWLRTIFAPQWGCRRGETWPRVTDVKDYDQLLSSIVKEMDANLKLDCFRGNEKNVMFPAE